MPVSHFLAPIAAATILNVFLVAWYWRSMQIEKRTGTEPWWFGVGLIVYAGAACAFLYLRHNQPVQTPLELFGAAIAGEAVGAMIVFGLVNAFVSLRGRPMRERAPAMVGALAALVWVVAALF